MSETGIQVNGSFWYGQAHEVRSGFG